MTVHPLLLVVFSLALAGIARADGEAAIPFAVDAHRPHRWSLQFQVGNDFRLEGFEGAGIAVTRNAGASDAWRLGVGWDGSLGSIDRTRQVVFNDTLVVDDPGPSDDTSRLRLAVDLLRLHRLHPGRRVGVEVGVGPRVSLDRNRMSSDDTSGSGALHRESTNTNWFVGAIVRLGAEVFVARSVSLHAHYGARAGYTSNRIVDELSLQSSTSSRVDRITIRGHSWGFGDEGVTMGVSLYL